jgi:hypothetical protein
VDIPADDDRFTIGSIPAVVYPAMLGATVGGQLLGMAFDALVLGRRLAWVPAACSVLLEALVGARFGAAQVGRPLTVAQSARLSVYYSLGFVALSLPLWGWTALAQESSSPRHGWLAAGALFACAVAGATLARWALMVLFAPKSAHGGASP